MSRLNVDQLGGQTTSDIEVISGNTLKVGVIAESSTNNGVQIDGVLIKDGQVDGVDVSAIVSGGLTEADSWRLTTNFTGDATPIASNLERDDTYGNGLLGTGMTESSGVFTFPSTGIYLVVFQATFVNVGPVSADNGIRPAIVVTTNGGSNWNTASGRYVFGHGSVNHYTLSETFKIVDVTDTSQVKVRFEIQNNGSNFTVEGSTNVNNTAMYFIRLGDT